MGCFTLGWLVAVLVWIVVVCAVVAIFRLLLPFVLSWLGVAGDLVMRIINIILAAIVIIFVIYLVYDLIMCMGPGMPRLR